MPAHYKTVFNPRQYMVNKDFEIFFYEDKVLSPVAAHEHDFYEVYFYLSGGGAISLGGKETPLSYGDFCLIPPGLSHNPVFKDNSLPYRRIVLWISPAYLELLKHSYEEILNCFKQSQNLKVYHYAPDSGSSQLLLNKLITILEEYKGAAAFHQSVMNCAISSFLLCLNRAVYDLSHLTASGGRPALFLTLCDYIGAHLEEDLTLDALAAYFHVSRYYISHLFKESIGISTHQYILRKRLNACKNALLSGMSIQETGRNFGFTDYTTFFRAFKKEFGMSPREFKDTCSLSPTPSQS